MKRPLLIPFFVIFRTEVVPSEEICKRCYRQLNEIDFLESQVSFKLFQFHIKTIFAYKDNFTKIRFTNNATWIVKLTLFYNENAMLWLNYTNDNSSKKLFSYLNSAFHVLNLNQSKKTLLHSKINKYNGIGFLLVSYIKN